MLPPQISDDSPALRAAVLSLSGKLPSSSSSSKKPPARLLSVPSSELLSPASRSFAGIPPSTHSQSASRLVAASARSERVSPRTSPSKELDDASSQAGPLVRLQRTLLQDAADDKRTPLYTGARGRHRSTSPTKGMVDSSSPRSISSLKHMFEDGPARQKPQALKSLPSNPSLTAAVLALQVPPAGDSPDPRGPYPNRVQVVPPSPTRTSPFHAPSLPPPLPAVRSGSSALSSGSSRESLVSRVSGADALAAATIAHASSTRPSPSPRPAGTTQTPQRAPRPPPPRKARSAAAVHPPLSPKRTGDSAIAASLAPSRTQTPGPRKPPVIVPPPPLPRRRRRHSLPTIPKAVLKETLRPPITRGRSPSPKPPRGRTPLSRRKGHHHAEALKHQWRWHITPKERRRYEGLWAANRGLLLSLAEKECVANVVVRDIWRRSTLDFRTLAEIWEIVDLGQKAMLSREEFVVGTWLVDMALRGGKVPVKVEDGVWDDVKSAGATLPPPPPRDKRMGRL